MSRNGYENIGVEHHVIVGTQSIPINAIPRVARWTKTDPYQNRIFLDENGIPLLRSQEPVAEGELITHYTVQEDQPIQKYANLYCAVQFDDGLEWIPVLFKDQIVSNFDGEPA